jgi:hypothetical protein
MRQIDRDHFELSTGRRVYAYGGVFGLGVLNPNDDNGQPLGDQVLPVYGFDGVVEEGHQWTPAERAELANHMIDQWREFGGVYSLAAVAVAFVREVAAIPKCDDDPTRASCELASGPYCGTHDVWVDTYIDKARAMLKDVG